MTHTYRRDRQELLWQFAISILAVGFFVIWALWDRVSLSAWCAEDGPIEGLTAILFGLSSIGFIVVAVRSDLLRTRTERWRHLMTLGWAVLMFVLMGEEVSWGQRIFGFVPPESVSSISTQGELNIHNLKLVDSIPGGTFRMISLFMLLTGLVLPSVALTKSAKRLVQRIAFPIAPIGYSLIFVGAYLFGRFYYPVDGIAASEVRELLLSLGMFSFALHGAVRPCVVFRTCRQR